MSKAAYGGGGTWNRKVCGGEQGGQRGRAGEDGWNQAKRVGLGEAHTSTQVSS